MSAQIERLVVEKPLVSKGYKKITSFGSAKGLDDGGAIPEGSRYAMLILETQDARWRDDGSNPTTTDGMKLVKDAPFWYSGPLASFKIIELVAGAVLHVTFYGE